MDKFTFTPLGALSIIITLGFWDTISCVFSYKILYGLIINLEV